MSHPLADIINRADGFLLIGESGKGRFPGLSYAAYTKAGRRFYCFDLDGLTESRGPIKGGKVYTQVDQLPADRDGLAVVWTTPASAIRAVDISLAAGCRRIWFSFGSVSPEAVAHARAQDMDVVELGRCPVYYLEGAPPLCKAHVLSTKITGTWRRPPQLDPAAKRREVF